MTILLVGGTGLLGSAIADELARRDEPVRVLAHSERSAATLRRRGFDVTTGDLLDPPSLARALVGVRAIVTTAQGDPLSRTKTFVRIDGQGQQNLIAAAAEARVEHLVLISALKADQTAVSVPQYEYKHMAEQSLRASGMLYTIIRPSSFQETFGDFFTPFKRFVTWFGLGMTLGSGTEQHSFVAVRDVARAARLALDRSEARNAVLPVGGPDNLSYRDAYGRIAQITKRRVTIVPVPHALLRLVGVVAAPLLPDLVAFFAMFAFFEQAGYTCETPGWLVDALGSRRTFDEGVRELYS